MTPEKLEYFKNKLLELQEEILSNIKSETQDEENPFEIDGDLADKAEAFNSATINEGLSTSQKKILDEIRKSLQRIKDGTYGKCVICSEEIELERLEILPYADKCKKHMKM